VDWPVWPLKKFGPDMSQPEIKSTTASATTTPAAGAAASKDDSSSSPKQEQPVVPQKSQTEGEQEGDGGYYPEEEITEGNWTTPQVEIKEVEVVTGEEKEETFWKHRAKLYRWGKEGSATGEWKERGLGEAKLLRHKDTGKIRFLLRQEKTLKIVANHYVLQVEEFCRLIPNVSSDRIWVWTVNDSADDEVKLQQFALKFGQVEQANIFKEKFYEAAQLNAKCFKLPTTRSHEVKAGEAAAKEQSPDDGTATSKNAEDDNKSKDE